mgnify:CR=1 FL=1
MRRSPAQGALAGRRCVQGERLLPDRLARYEHRFNSGRQRVDQLEQLVHVDVRLQYLGLVDFVLAVDVELCALLQRDLDLVEACRLVLVRVVPRSGRRSNLR